MRPVFGLDEIVTYLLDTSAISALMREDPRMSSWLASLESDDRLVTCAIVRGEILFGLERLPEGQRRTVAGREGSQRVFVHAV